MVHQTTPANLEVPLMLSAGFNGKMLSAGFNGKIPIFGRCAFKRHNPRVSSTCFHCRIGSRPIASESRPLLLIVLLCLLGVFVHKTLLPGAVIIISPNYELNQQWRGHVAISWTGSARCCCCGSRGADQIHLLSSDTGHSVTVTVTN